MIQRLLMLAVSLAVFCEPAFGLGLGKLDLQSYLNQEFQAEIELTNIGALSDQEILPALASQEDFDRVGVDRNYLLTNLRFSVGTNDEGERVILVTSTRPIIEPFLNFLVEVIWPNGRILREYTVLLDPPTFAEKGVQPLQPAASSRPAAAPAPRPQQQPAARQTTGDTVRTAPRGGGALLEEGEVIGDEYGVTGPGDTLWKIAARVRPDSSVTIQQTMLALQRANPDAFINNNINLLKAGHVLRIPDVREIREESARTAVAEVQDQNDQFEDYRAGGLAQMDATPRRRQSSSAAGDDEDGELKIVAANRGSGQRAGDNNQDEGGNSEALGSELAAAREDLDRSRRQTTELAVRLDDLQEQVETLNEIVKLKDDQLAALRAELQKAMDAEAAAPAPASQPSPAASGSLLTNPLVLGALALLVVLVAGGLFFWRRRQSAAGDAIGEETELDDLPLADVATTEAGGLDETIEIEEELVGSDDDDELEPQTSDLISEAEIYIAYGRFPQAITFLQNAIEAEPTRADLQLKLLEVYVQTEDATAFNLQYEQMQLLGDDEANARAAELQQQIPGAAESAAASMEATIISSEPVTPIAAEDDDDDLSFDLDDLDADTGDDDELSLDLEDDEAATVILDTPVSQDSDDADLDLALDDDDLSLSLDDDEGEELSLDLDADDELELDLEDEGGELSLDLDDEADAPALELDESDELTLDLEDDDGDELTLDLEDDEGDELSLDLESGEDDDALSLDLDDSDDELSLDLDDSDDDALTLDLDDSDDDALTLDLEESDDSSLDLESEDDEPVAAPAATEDDDALTLDLDDDDLDLDAMDLDDTVEISADDDALTLDDDLDLGDDLDLDDTLSLDDVELDLGDDDDAADDVLTLEDDDLDLDELALGDEATGDDDDDNTFELDLEADDDIDLDALDLDDDLDLGDDLGELDLGDDDTGSKLDLARAYIDMGDHDGARELLQEVMNDGGEDDVQAATELMAKLD